VRPSEPDRRARAAGSPAPGPRGSRRLRAPAGWRGLVASAALGLALAAGACRPVNPTEDARIEAEVKAALVAERSANLTRLGVLSSGGVVYLSGTVASADEKARAAALSRSVQGVRRVVNTLEVRAP
jgi:hypothetical protein